ncbi:MAG: hypothetical protein R2771_12220 [Saprospiraceae bacterium]
MRPKIVDEKNRFGDFEIDTVIGKNHKGALLTMNDRVSSLVFIRKLVSKDAIPVSSQTIETLNLLKIYYILLLLIMEKNFLIIKLSLKI